MTRYFADAYFYIALLNKKDPHHQWARTIASVKTNRYVTTRFVLMEVADALCAPAHRAKVAELHQHLQTDPNTETIPATEELAYKGLELYGSRLDKDWSLTDCTSFIVMRDEGLMQALTGDAHFRQAGFLAAAPE